MDRRTGLTVVGPKTLQIESYTHSNADGQPDEESVWLLSRSSKTKLKTPALVEGNPFALDSFAIGANADFIFGVRKVDSGESDMFLWVRQKDKSYKLLPETVNQWIVRRTKASHRGGPITFVRLVRWFDNGNGVALAYTTGGRGNPWYSREIDLVRGKFAPARAIAESKFPSTLI